MNSNQRDNKRTWETLLLAATAIVQFVIFFCCCPYHRRGKMWRNVHFLDWNSRLKTGIFHNLYLEFSLKFQSVSAINRYWGLHSTNRFNLFTFSHSFYTFFFLSFLPFDPFFRMLLLPSTVAVRCILNEFTSVEINTRCASGKSIVSRLFFRFTA